MSKRLTICFDLDDTLYKERSFHISAFGEAARITAAFMDPEEVRTVMTAALLRRENHYSALEELADRKGVRHLLDMPRIVEACRSHYPEAIGSSGDAGRVIEGLTAEGHQCVIITDGRTLTQRNKLRSLGLGHIPAYISAEQGAEKTDPLMFLNVMRDYPDTELFVYIGDNTAKDFLHPNRLGWFTVGLTDLKDENIHPQRRDADADHAPRVWIDTLSTLGELLKKSI